MTQQHKASLLPQKQGKLEVSTRLTPTPRGTQALVKVTAAAVNPADWKIIETGLFLETYPAVLGYDGAGIIHAVGPEVTNFKVGDRVIFQGTLDYDYTAYQEYALVDTELIAKAPSNVNDDQASTFPTGAFTAYAGLFQKTGIATPVNGPTAKGKSVLILGGSSSVGQFAIQFARIAGFSTIATTASSQHTEFLKSLGATHVFDRDTDATTIRSAFPSPLGLAFDAISANATQLLAFDLLANPSPVSGTHLTIVNHPTDDFKEKNTGDKIAVHNVFGFSDKFRDLSVPFWQKLGEWIEGGELVPNRVQLVNGGLAGVPDALELSRKGVSGVKLVIRPQE
ncbi:Alcohol dehydrogenase GroES-like domain [Rhizoctonia solani]|uniref:Alcohol dehydrogenase GroES-like domain n=1 Tax=Rhizoctonia solani TaxID=456999 RepID=A0A8H7H8G6_9AGAM|nr:Alcohol dehydrogenase GroES-like domain [Rhizoctonia solani]